MIKKWLICIKDVGEAKKYSGLSMFWTKFERRKKSVKPNFFWQNRLFGKTCLFYSFSKFYKTNNIIIKHYNLITFIADFHAKSLRISVMFQSSRYFENFFLKTIELNLKRINQIWYLIKKWSILKKWIFRNEKMDRYMNERMDRYINE